MKKKIYFKDGIIDGESKRAFNDIIPFSRKHFKQRKTYDEYCFESFEWDFTLNEFEELSNTFMLEVSSDRITIKSDY